MHFGSTIPLGIGFPVVSNRLLTELETCRGHDCIYPAKTAVLLQSAGPGAEKDGCFRRLHSSASLHSEGLSYDGLVSQPARGYGLVSTQTSPFYRKGLVMQQIEPKFRKQVAIEDKLPTQDFSHIIFLE